MNEPNEPLATRDLKWIDEDGERAVSIRVWKPIPFDENYICDFAVDGLPKPGRASVAGVDSLDALINAIDTIRIFLDPHRERLSWLDEPAWHGVPRMIRAPNGIEEQRRLEELVEREIELSLEKINAPAERREAQLRARYDPNPDEGNLEECSTEVLVDRLRSAAKTERDYREAGNDDAAFVFSQKRWPFIRALGKRPNYLETLRELTVDENRSLRLVAAQLLLREPIAIATLERLRDDGAEPEASEASRTLQTVHRWFERPKPWGD